MYNLLKYTKNNKEKYWKKLLFTDLHVSTKSLDRTIDVLRKVRELSCTELLNDKPTPVVFLGDFWHQRDVLHVRHIDQLLKEFDKWNESDIDTTLIPGNHDQVSIDGTVHGVQLFSLFPNFKVATDPILDAKNGLAYLPWRETKEDQNRQFQDLSKKLPNNSSIHSKWTVFAHAEAKGAVANGGYSSNGKFDLESGSIRSCYLGHYHKRQQISSNYWYIGSPYEQNYGEMNDPHGVAFVDSKRIEPYFVDFNDLPKHHKLIFPFDISKLNSIKSNDFVEIKATKDMMRSKEFIEAIESLPKPIEIRRLLVNEDNSNNNISNDNSNQQQQHHNKFKIEDFLETYINNRDIGELNKAQLLYLGKNILSSIKEPTIVPLGRKVQIQKISISNFCGILGDMDINFKDEDLFNNKMVLIRGPMGSGKSTIFEALVWCLYGNTSPKKQSSSSSSIKSEQVINDNASEASVSVEILVDDKPFVINRSKKKGSGSKVAIEGSDLEKQGVMDQQNFINNIIGLDYESFRMSIYLGQGSISNFVTDSNKRKKELLSRIFSLGHCIPAHKSVKDLRKKKEGELNDFEKSLLQLETTLKTWSSIDYTALSNEWEENNLKRINELRNDIQSETSVLDQLKEGYSGEIISNIKQERTNISNIVQSLEFESESINREINGLVTNYSRKVGNNNNKITSLEKSVEFNNAQLKYWLDYIDKQKCNQCGQKISDELLKSTKATVDTKIAHHRQLASEQQFEIYDLEEEIDQLEEDQIKQTKELENRKVSNQLELSKYKLQLNDINTKLHELEKSEIKINSTIKSIKEKESRLLEIPSKNPFSEKEKEKELNTAQLSAQIQDLSVKINESKFQLKELEFWEDGFSSDGLPMMALQNLVKEVENYANEYLSKLSKGQLFTNLSIQDDELSIDIFEIDPQSKIAKPRSLYQLSGGQRRCLELSYSPFALSEVIFNHSGSRVSFMVIDELTNHLDSSVKPIICDLMRNIKERDHIFVIDHDISIQSEFDQVFDLEKDNNKTQLKLLN